MALLLQAGAPVPEMLTLMQMHASCQPWPGAYCSSKTLTVPWTMYPRLGCTQILSSCRPTGQLVFPQGSHKMLQNCQNTSFSGSSSYSVFLSFFLTMSQSHPAFVLLRPH